MKLVFIIILNFLLISPAFSQDETGIYLTIVCAKNAPQKKVLISDKQICIADHAIVPLTELLAIGDLKEVGSIVFFDITFSDKAINTMGKITKTLPSSTFAFVVGQDVFSTFEAYNLTIGRTFRFQGENKDKSIFSGIQKRLQTLIESNAK